MELSKVIEMMICPKCKNSNLLLKDNLLTCNCGMTASNSGGIMDLLGEEDLSSNIIQDAMRFKPLIRIYDNIWRYMSFPLLTNISFAKKIRTILTFQGSLSGAKILDIACGTGTFSRRFADKTGNEGLVVAIDASMPMLNQAVKTNESKGYNNIVFIRANAQCLPFKEMQFDGINCTGALHLFKDSEVVLNSIYKMLKPNGVFSCMTFCQSPIAMINKLILNMGIRFFNPENLYQQLKNVGFTQYQEKKSRLMLLFSVTK